MSTCARKARAKSTEDRGGDLLGKCFGSDIGDIAARHAERPVRSIGKVVIVDV